MNGVFVIDKPSGLTSHDVVNRARRILGERSVGHLGTLDPMATGALPLVVGNLTRLAQFYTESEKTYEGTIRFGFSTDTYDADGDPTSQPQDVQVSHHQIETAATRFRGIIEQLPPPFSAKKIKGVPAYKLAQKKKEVHLQPVCVEIKEFAIFEMKNEFLHFRACVSSGTYIRSIAHEIGVALGCGAHLASLRRTRHCEFDVADAHTLDQLHQAAADNRLQEIMVHPRELLPNFPSVTANEDMINFITCGRAVNLPEFSSSRYVKVFRGQRELISIASRVAGTLFHPKIVLLNEPARQLAVRSN